MTDETKVSERASGLVCEFERWVIGLSASGETKPFLEVLGSIEADRYLVARTALESHIADLESENRELRAAFVECYAAVDPTWTARADWRELYERVKHD